MEKRFEYTNIWFTKYRKTTTANLLAKKINY